MANHYAVVVRRGSAFDQERPSSEQAGYAPHSLYWRELEATGFVAMAGLMLSSMEVLFIIRAQSEDEVRQTIEADVWQETGHARIVRLEPIDIRFGAPAPL